MSSGCGASWIPTSRPEQDPSKAFSLAQIRRCWWRSASRLITPPAGLLWGEFFTAMGGGRRVFVSGWYGWAVPCPALGADPMSEDERQEWHATGLKAHVSLGKLIAYLDSKLDRQQ